MIVTNTGILGRSTSSSIRYKNSIEYLTNEQNATTTENKMRKLNSKSSLTPENILDIPIVTFKYNEGYVTGESDFDYEKPIMGFIAEDVANIVPECATYIKNEKGEEIPEAWDINQLTVRMLYVIQQQEKRISELEKLLEKENK